MEALGTLYTHCNCVCANSSDSLRREILGPRAAIHHEAQVCRMVSCVSVLHRHLLRAFNL